MSDFKLEIIEEAGFKSAMLGLSLNKSQNPDNMPNVLNKLAPLENGHNKALRQLCVWVDIDAPRYLWSEIDTYKVGTVSQSESTMHTITKRMLELDDFIENEISISTLNELNYLIDQYQKEQDSDKQYGIFLKIKRKLPEGFLQRRVVLMNYQVVRTMLKQRKTHRLPEWRQFCKEIVSQLQHPEYIKDLIDI